MKTIRFVSYHELNKQGSPMKWDYRCDDAPYDVNMSGTYVPASEANELLLENANLAKAICNHKERIKMLEDALKEIAEYTKFISPRVCEAARAALEVKP